ncbi:hypothetical protein F5Y14DRAFT_426245 [Nemania sp. NC0429]|nr:hypothetical protein F5Y14DRAFT_426245 [Nemania sp. NC0429]
MQRPQVVGWAQTWCDDINVTHRLRAIRGFGKAVSDPVAWKQSWDEAGGTPGILYLLSSASVTEVKAFCHVIRAANRRGNKSADRERAVEELVMALLPQHYPSTKLCTHDKRPLQKYYGRMLQACSSNFVEQILDAQDKSNPLFQQLKLKRFLFAHETMLKRRLTNYLIHDGPPVSESEMDICLDEFISRGLPYPGTQPNMSASMEFAHELLQARTTIASTAKRWPGDLSEMAVLMSVYRRSKRKSRSADKTFLLRLGLALIELRPGAKRSSDAEALLAEIVKLWKRHPDPYEDLLSQGLGLGIRPSNTLLAEIATRWREEPDRYEKLLVHGLRQGLGGTAAKISEGYLKTISGVPRPELTPQLQWRLLRLYCQHVPQKGIDIETSSDFTCLANQEWAFEIVNELERERVVSFLDRLYEVNPNFDFLKAPKTSPSIYYMRKASRRNFNVELLKTAYHERDADAQQRARDEVDQLRKKAATSREQAERALLAKAAAFYAIATGELELYAETLIWQQRFVGDNLTAKSIFSSDAILTKEGVALLSGITLSSAEDTTWSAIRQRLAVANSILESFNEAHQLAKKEPSYKQGSWSSLSVLYRDVYKERVSRAKKVQLQPQESGTDMFHVIWEGTVQLVDSIGSTFLSQVNEAVLSLADELSGPSLIAASETLLNFAAIRGKKEGRSKEEDKIVTTIEQLAYRVVSKLAYSNTPVLAQDLIRRVIIEHPEASSWHRQFLSIGYMRDLPANAARTMLLSFAAAIGEKLEEQSYVKVGDEEPPKSAPPKSLVKVTTVKYLAQLLNDADFISPDAAVDVLIELFRSSTHIDVRVATLDSLLSTLNGITGDSNDQWRSNTMVERILNTLDDVISIAGNINERRPVSATEWAEASSELTIPATSDSSTIPPLFEAVLKAATGERFPNLKKLQGELFSRLVLPALHHSQEQHHKWFSLFLAKHWPALDANILPRVPITPQIWNYMLNHQGHLLPPTIINDYNQYILFRLRAPVVVKTFGSTLQSDATLRNDASVNHWESIFGEPWQSQLWEGQIKSLISLLVAPAEKASSTTDLISAVASQASVLLDDYENHMGKWTYFVASLEPVGMTTPSSSGQGGSNYDKDMEKAWASWHDATVRLAQSVITLMRQKKAASADQGNAVLPSTFPVRLWCLPYLDPRAVQQEEGFRHLATALGQSLSSYLNSDEGDMLLWTTLVDDTCTRLASIYTDLTSRLYIAVHVGDLNLDPDQTPVAAVQLIRVAVALRFVDLVSQKGALRKPKLKNTENPTAEQARTGELVRKLRAVMDSWGPRDAATGKQAPFRDMVLQWKHGHRSLWGDICSWGSGGSKDEIDVASS